MRKLSKIINEYFIASVNSSSAKEALTYRATLTQDERYELPMPITDNLSDAIYVVLGCRFQDNPLKSLAVTIIFIVMMGLLLAHFITSFI